MLRITLALMAVATPAIVGAQGIEPRQTADSAVARAVALANDQRMREARALLDSVLRNLQPASQRYAEVLFWKGKLSDSEQVAEDSYKKIILDFPLHRRAEESLILLAGLEMMRGNRTQAQRYLDRIIVEHPYGSHRATASYWRARLFFEENEVERACAELGVARTRLTAGDAELRTEIDFAAQSCRNVPTPTQPPQQKAETVASRGGRGDSAPGSASRGGRGGAQTAQNSAGRGAQQSAGRGAAGQKAGAVSPPGAGSKAAGTQSADASRVMYTVQVAAFPLKENADAFVQALKARGYEARVFGTASPYRIRVGMYQTRDEAAKVAAELKSKRVSSDAFVTEAERR